MKDIEVVIKIPEEIMEYVKNNGCLSVIYTDEVAKAIINGTLCEQTEVKGDLISREWLSNKFAEKSDYGEVDSNNGYFSLEEIYDIIDKGPTVEERPKGVWIVKQEMAGAFVGDRSVYSYTCPFCKAKEFKKYPFCHCGAEMRGISDGTN